jgi:hypothetical protein
MKKTIKCNETTLHNLIKECVYNVINQIKLHEGIGGSSINGYNYDFKNNNVNRNQGGGFGGSKLDQYYDSNHSYKNQLANEREKQQEFYKQWCYNRYNDCSSIPAFKNGNYKKCYQILTGKPF